MSKWKIAGWTKTEGEWEDDGVDDWSDALDIAAEALDLLERYLDAEGDIVEVDSLASDLLNRCTPALPVESPEPPVEDFDLSECNLTKAASERLSEVLRGLHDRLTRLEG